MHLKKYFKKHFLLFSIILAVIILIAIFFNIKHHSDVIYGTSFNPEYAAYLGLDPKAVYMTILDDWKFKYIRLPAQWDLIEKVQGKKDFSDLDWMMGEAEKRGVKIILAVGQKTPRWPECHIPDWAAKLPDAEYKASLSDYISSVIGRYKNNPALEIWQVENEAFLPFGGGCRNFTQNDLKNELSLVKSTDAAHPTMTTDAGELSLWWRTANKADLFGFSVYRVVWSQYTGYWSYDWLLPPMGFNTRLWMDGRSISTAYVTELQAEPWIPSGVLTSTPVNEQFKSMDINRLKGNIAFASEIGVSRAYLWGAEWWYWLEKQGNKSFADYIMTLRKQ